jgi:DNA helicase-2/ATP-dependent DNA helicase PcrA
MHPLRFYAYRQPRHGDRHVYAPRSRFLPASSAGCFEAHAWGAATPAGNDRADGLAGGTPDDAAKSLAPAPVDIGARMREMW